MDKFEKILREKLQHHEAGMPAGEWEKFSQRLDGLTPKPSPWKAYLVGGIAAAAIGLGAYYMVPSSEKEKQQPTVENTNTAQNGNHNNRVVASGKAQGNTHTANNNEAGPDAAIGYTEPNVNEENNSKDISNKQNEEKAVVVNENNKTNHNNKTTNNESIANNKQDKNRNNASATLTDNKLTDHKTNNVQQTVQAIQLPEPEISGNVREICQHTEISFKAANNRNDHDMTWLLNGEEVSTDADFKVSFNKPGAQTIQLVYGSVQEGKRITRESEKRIINVMPAPLADINVNQVNDYSPEYMFKSAESEGNEYMWNFGDGKVQTGNEITHVYRKKGEYNVGLTVTAANGCKTRKAERLEIESDYNLLAPNSFTPNSDGRNDVFIPEALKVMNDARFRMIIFDKSGKKIFETTRLDNPWDGRNSTNGTYCQPDAYVWRVELSKADGTKEEYMGSVTILP